MRKIFIFAFVVLMNCTLCFGFFILFYLWNLYQRDTPQRVSANISGTFNQKSLAASSVIAALLFSCSVVAGKPGTMATWFRSEVQCTGMRVLVGVWMHKSSFLLCLCLFFEPEQKGCHGDEVGLSPTAWSGKISSLPWHLHRLEETETMEQRHTDIHTHHTRKECVFVCVCWGVYQVLLAESRWSKR